MIKSLVTLFFSCLFFNLSGQPQPEKPIVIKKTHDFTIEENKINDAWSQTEWIVLSRAKGNLSYATMAKLLYSDKGIYALFSCDDKKIKSTKREDFADLWKEDVVEVFFWPDESVPLYFEYELSPLNYELPILVPNLNGNFLGWKPWQYEGDRKTKHVTRISKDQKENVTGWTGEFFIPYALLKPLQNIPPQSGTQWRANMYRLDYDETQPTSWVWKPVKTNFHDYTNFGRIVFE